jgi:O-antigen ligase
VSSSSWQRVLYPGLLLFGLSLSLSKSASSALIVAVYLGAIAGALFCREFRDNVIRSCRQGLTAALALFCLVAYAGVISTEKYSDGFKVANKFVSLPAIYFLVSVLLQSEQGEDARGRRAESLLFSFLAGLAALNLLGVLKFIGAFGGEPFVLPLAPLGMHHIWYSNLNALGLYTAVALLVFTRRGGSSRGRSLLGGFLLLSTLCILLSTSRTAWFSIVLTAAIMAAVAIRRKRTIALVLLLSALAITAAYQSVPLVHDRVNLVARDLALYSADHHAESSVGARLILWEAALSMAKSHPLIGVGTGDFVSELIAMRRARLIPKFLLEFNQPHNIYLFSLATNGIVGLAALLFVFYRSLRSAVPALRNGGDGKVFAFLALAATVHFMVAGFMDSFFNIQVLRYSFAFIMGVCVRTPLSGARRP